MGLTTVTLHCNKKIMRKCSLVCDLILKKTIGNGIDLAYVLKDVKCLEFITIECTNARRLVRSCLGEYFSLETVTARRR